MEQFEEWFKPKKYPHIGRQISIKDYSKVKAYVYDTAKIIKHSFLPFLHKTIIKRKFRADKENPQRNPSGKRKRIKSKPKIRDTFFASHLDAMVFSRYNQLLSEAYENFIKYQPFNSSVVAYRKIPIEKETKGNQCNIDFAKTAFKFIHENNVEFQSVIIADITSFFDNLDHKILKRQWSIVLGEKTLPKDHYNLYKALTRIKYVETTDLFKAYNNTMLVQKGVPFSNSEKQLVRKQIKSPKYFKEKRAYSYCEKDEFLSNNLNLIISKNNKAGIPQGSPISATLANIYMLDFDKSISNEVSRLDGFYQRYSDDIIIVCKREYEEEIKNFLMQLISSHLVNLTIEPNKTKIYHFQRSKNELHGYQIDENRNKAAGNKPLEYLGFTYNGKKVLIKSSGFSKFYRSMKQAFNRSHGFAKHSKNPDKKLFKSKLYKKFTYKGAKRKLIYRPLKNNPRIYVASKEYDWGNYLNYIYKSNDTMKTLNNDNTILKQSKKFWSNFHKLLKHHERILANIK